METSNNQSSNAPKIIAAILGVLVICSCVAIVGAGVLAYQAFRLVPPEISTAVFPTEEFTTPAPIPTLERPEVGSISTETLETLEQTLVPENDPNELACRLQAVCNVPDTVPAKQYQVGDRETFWVSNTDTAEHRQGDFTLLYSTPHSYFWAEEGTDVNEGDMKALMDTFEEKIYPTDREFFGSEANPGVDNDPHVYVLYANDIGSNVAGYYNSSDTFNPSVKEFSNAHDTYVLGSDQDLGVAYTYATLAHEFVHMIQNAYDRNEVSWINEGFAELGSFLNSYDIG